MSGPGKVDEYGWIDFTEGHREAVNVDFDVDGSVSIEWNEKSDDFWGTQTREVSFSAEEFEQIVAERAAYLARASS